MMFRTHPRRGGASHATHMVVAFERIHATPVVELWWRGRALRCVASRRRRTVAADVAAGEVARSNSSLANMALVAVAVRVGGATDAGVIRYP